MSDQRSARWGRWGASHSKSLADYCIKVRKGREVIVWQVLAIRRSFKDFCTEPFLCFRVSREQVEDAGECVGGRVGGGKDQCSVKNISLRLYPNEGWIHTQFGR